MPRVIPQQQTQVSILPVPAHSNNYKYGGQQKPSFYIADIISLPSNDLLVCKEWPQQAS